MIEVRNENPNFKAGDTVWWINFNGVLESGTLVKIDHLEKEDFAHIRQGVNLNIVTGTKLSKCWSTRKECEDAEIRRSELQKQEYRESIKDVKDLVAFLFTHTVRGEDRDFDAEVAAKDRAKELLGMTVKGGYVVWQ